MFRPVLGGTAGRRGNRRGGLYFFSTRRFLISALSPIRSVKRIMPGYLPMPRLTEPHSEDLPARQRAAVAVGTFAEHGAIVDCNTSLAGRNDGGMFPISELSSPSGAMSSIANWNVIFHRRSGPQGVDRRSLKLNSCSPPRGCYLKAKS